MTRRGSLVYYLTGWVCGSFFLAVAVWIHSLARGGQPLFVSKGAADLLTIYFFSLAFGWFQSIFGAFFLRRIAIYAKFDEPWQWFLTGAALWPLLIFLLDKIGGSATWGPDSSNSGWTLFILGAMIVRREAIWIAAPAGGLAALVLFAVNRSFAPRPEPDDATNQPSGKDNETERKRKKKSG
ncbi:MAG: hypothetical protein ACLP1Y_15775 [Candidatus Acidiferrales bacterium]